MTDWVGYAQSLLTEVGLSRWSVEISRGRRTIGLCSYADRTIYLSKHHIDNDSYDDVKDTVIHEVAHALNPADGHGSKWKNTAISLGGSGEQYHAHGKSYPSKWSTMCINGHEPKIFRWNQDTIYNCKCGSPVYIKRSDGTQLMLSEDYVRRFNYLARRHQVPLIDSHGMPQI